MEEPPLNSPHQRLRRWRKAAVALNASWRFSDHSMRALQVDHRQSDQTGANQRDLEANSSIVPSTASARLLSTRSILAKQIKRMPQLVSAVLNGAPQDDEHKQLQKRCSKYSQKALLFAITTFMAYLGSSSASSSTRNTVFKVAMAALFLVIPVDLISATRTPKWCCALVYLSWFLLVLQSYLLLVSIHKDYICAIIPVLFFAALLLWKQPSGQQDSNEVEPAQRLDSNIADDQDKGDQDLENIFDCSAGIVNCGGLISMILGHYMYMVGPNRLASTSVIGFLFFFTVVVGLYLMMVTTVRTAALTPNVSFFAYLRDFLLVGTLIATLIHGVGISWNDNHV